MMDIKLLNEVFARATWAAGSRPTTKPLERNVLENGPRVKHVQSENLISCDKRIDS